MGITVRLSQLCILSALLLEADPVEGKAHVPQQQKLGRSLAVPASALLRRQLFATERLQITLCGNTPLSFLWNEPTREFMTGPLHSRLLYSSTISTDTRSL